MTWNIKKKVHKRPMLTSHTAASIWSSAPPPSWIDLPTDVTANILHRLDVTEKLKSAQLVCSTWWRVCKEDPSMWRVIDMKNSGGHGDPNKYIYYDFLESMCLRAVDRSQGELININIEYFCTDDILIYISDRSPRLKRLRIACSGFLSSGLVAAVKKWPELEELHLFYTKYISAEDIESIAISCPILKSFTYNRRCFLKPILEIDDSCALVIAKNMPNLRQLRLFGNKLSDQGLQAILDGCPHLELLDLRQCLRVDLQGGLDKRCSERIKDLRRPSDSTADYEWDDEVYEYEDVSDCDDVEFDSGSDEYDSGDDEDEGQNNGVDEDEEIHCSDDVF